VTLTLDKNINYIVSGLERSGTSMMMQILDAGNIPLEYDTARTIDENNPKGYYELEGGKIISKLREGTFPLKAYKGRFIKITAFGLQYLPPGSYKIIYIERNLDEVLDSMEKMARIIDENRELTKESFRKLNEKVKQEIQRREDIVVLLLNYNEMLRNPQSSIQKIGDFIGVPSVDKQRMISVIDNRLYRQRR
jgi:hypothetical protein